MSEKFSTGTINHKQTKTNKQTIEILINSETDVSTHESTSSLIQQANLLSRRQLIDTYIMLKYTLLIKRLACAISNAYQ